MAATTSNCWPRVIGAALPRLAAQKPRDNPYQHEQAEPHPYAAQRRRRALLQRPYRRSAQRTRLQRDEGLAVGAHEVHPTVGARRSTSVLHAPAPRAGHRLLRLSRPGHFEQTPATLTRGGVDRIAVSAVGARGLLGMHCWLGRRLHPTLGPGRRGHCRRRRWHRPRSGPRRSGRLRLKGRRGPRGRLGSQTPRLFLGPGARQAPLALAAHRHDQRGCALSPAMGAHYVVSHRSHGRLPTADVVTESSPDAPNVLPAPDRHS